MTTSLKDLKRAMLLGTLRSCRLFTGLPVEDLENIADVTVSMALEKGEYIFHEGNVVNGFYIVQRGAINVHRVTSAGKEQVIHVFRTGDSFAEIAVVSPGGYPADARAQEPTQILLVRRDGFLELLKRQPDLALRMLGSMSSHLRVLVSQLEDLTARDVETRLANWLIKRCPDPQSESPITIELTAAKRTLAAELGTVSETFSRTLAKFREQKLIVVKGKIITVLSPVKLATLLRRNLGE